MPIKNFVYRCQPVWLCVVLVLSICYFSVQLVLSHITHSLTLLMAAYHMLCNIFALTGCIVTIKHSKCNIETKNALEPLKGGTGSGSGDNSTTSTDDTDPVEHIRIGDKVIVVNVEEQSLAKRERREMKLRNTFGWTRIDILTMLIVCIILASLSFSLLVEALQTLVHIDHQDTMHLPLYVLGLGIVGILLNAITYALIGGYTLHQGSFLQLKPNGDVVLNREFSNSGNVNLQPNDRQLSKMKNNEPAGTQPTSKATAAKAPMKRQGAVEILRDVSSTIFVIVCAVIVYMAQDKEHTAKFIDPILSIFSCVLLVSLSYPYMQEACLILLQTIPGSIDLSNFERTLVESFPHIVNYHDLHIWQLSSHKYVATVHITFQNAALYAKTIDDVIEYFHAHDIAEVTVQPEFHVPGKPSMECLIQCCDPRCSEKVCCKGSRNELREITTATGDATDPKQTHSHGHAHAVCPSNHTTQPSDGTANVAEESCNRAKQAAPPNAKVCQNESVANC